MKILLPAISLLLFALINCKETNAQSKEDIFGYFKNRVEEFCINDESTLYLNGCQMKYTYYRTLSGNVPWTQEYSFSLKDVVDVFFVYLNNSVIITIRLKDDAMIITDIARGGRRDFVNFHNSLKWVFHEGTLSQSDGKKMSELFKKLAKSCGAKIIEL